MIKEWLIHLLGGLTQRDLLLQEIRKAQKEGELADQAFERLGYEMFDDPKDLSNGECVAYESDSTHIGFTENGCVSVGTIFGHATRIGLDEVRSIKKKMEEMEW